MDTLLCDVLDIIYTQPLYRIALACFASHSMSSSVGHNYGTSFVKYVYGVYEESRSYEQNRNRVREQGDEQCDHRPARGTAGRDITPVRTQRAKREVEACSRGGELLPLLDITTTTRPGGRSDPSQRWRKSGGTADPTRPNFRVAVLLEYRFRPRCCGGDP